MATEQEKAERRADDERHAAVMAAGTAVVNTQPTREQIEEESKRFDHLRTNLNDLLILQKISHGRFRDATNMVDVATMLLGDRPSISDMLVVNGLLMSIRQRTPGMREFDEPATWPNMNQNTIHANANPITGDTTPAQTIGRHRRHSDEHLCVLFSDIFRRWCDTNSSTDYSRLSRKIVTNVAEYMASVSEKIVLLKADQYDAADAGWAEEKVVECLAMTTALLDLVADD